ncbi:MAG TPA: hypothetical protein GXZ60_12175 [Intrasporangiaceae bacterium]|nr:hypothetical protein [Intrasporangiaceae bacterium]
MDLMAMLPAIIPSVLFLLLWGLGLLLSAIHSDRARWRSLAMAGFAVLALGALVGMSQWIYYFFSQDYSSFRIWGWTGLGLIQLLLQLIGSGLLVGAVLSGRGQRQPSPQVYGEPGAGGYPTAPPSTP